jgi:hypothetical protein
MDYRTIANSDALVFLERLNTATATLLYFDPPAGTGDKCDCAQLRSLYLHATCHAKRILSDSGILVWHALPERASDARNCLERVFGSHLFAMEIVLKRNRHIHSFSKLTSNHSSLILFSKTGEFFYEPPTRLVSDIQRLYPQNDCAGAYRLCDITTSVNRPNLQFTWHNHTPPPGRSWRYNLPKLEELHANGRIVVSKSKFPREKSYLNDHPTEEIGSVWDDIDLPSAERVSRNINNQQSLALMMRVVSMLTRPDDIVVDPFCGTGTTLVAAQQLGRKWLGADTSQTTCTQAVSRLQMLTRYESNYLTKDEVWQLPVQSSLTELIRNLLPLHESPHDDIHQLIVQPESKTLEFKQTLSIDVRTNEKLKHIETASLKTIAAFLNSDGGILLVGVTDDNKPTGLDDEIIHFHKGSADKFLLHFSHLLRDTIGEEFYPMLEYQLVPIDGKSILRVNCKKSDRPCFIGDDFYVRTNPATDKLSGRTMLQYVSTRFPNSSI